jgi:hypothetical protein
MTLGPTEMTARRYQQLGEYAVRTFPDQTLLLPVRNHTADLDSLYVLNEVGAFLWTQLKTPQSEACLVDALMLEYAIDQETASRDVKDFLNRLIGDKLLSVSG